MRIKIIIEDTPDGKVRITRKSVMNNKTEGLDEKTSPAYRLSEEIMNINGKDYPLALSIEKILTWSFLLLAPLAVFFLSTAIWQAIR